VLSRIAPTSLLNILHVRGGLLLPTPTGSLLRLFSSVFGVATPTIRHGLSWSSRNRQLTPHRKKRSAGGENDLVPAPLNSGLPVHVRSFTDESVVGFQRDRQSYESLQDRSCLDVTVAQPFVCVKARVCPRLLFEIGPDSLPLGAMTPVRLSHSTRPCG
jgi:hypothetical protein